MSAHVLLILLNKLGESDKMRGLSIYSILSLFLNEFDKTNKTVVRNVTFYLSYEIKIKLKLCCYGQYVMFSKICINH